MVHEEPFAAVGKRIEALRGAMTQVEFARRLSVDRKSVAGWESGKRLPDGTSLLRLVTEFGADVNYILTGRHTGDAPAAPALTREEEALLDNFRHCPPDARRAIKATSDALAKYEGCCLTKKSKGNEAA